MKVFVGVDAGSYVFDPSAKTITFSDLPSFGLEQVLLVTNSTQGVILYNFIGPYSTYGGSLAGNVLTLNASCSGMSSSDRLQIILNIPGIAESKQKISGDGHTVANLLELILIELRKQSFYLRELPLMLSRSDGFYQEGDGILD